MDLFQKYLCTSLKEWSVNVSDRRALARFPQHILYLTGVWGIMFLISCGKGKMIYDQGVGTFSIGENWPPTTRSKWRGQPIVDTTFMEGGYEWKGLILKGKEGQIILEEDFFNEGKLNRVRVESPRFITPYDVSVGQEWGGIKEKSSSWIYNWLANYQLMDISHPSWENIHLLIAPQEGFQLPHDYETWLQTLSDTSVVQSIVVM